MPFTTSFTVTQGATCSQFQVNDTSDYSTEGTGTFANRKLTIQKSDGSYLVHNSITYNQYTWPFGTNTITITGLDQDYAYKVTLTHTSNAPQPGSVYTKDASAVLKCFTLSGFYTFSNKMAVNQSLEKDYKYVKDVMRLFIEQESATKAGTDGDFAASQACLDRAKNIIDNLTIGY